MDPSEADDHMLAPARVVGIGASAGGLNALGKLFEAIPGDTGMAFVVVSHLAADADSHLADLLGTHTRLPVLRISDGLAMRRDHAYVSPPGFELELSDGQLRLVDPDPQRPAHAPIDRFFRALARERGRDAIAVLLSGAGADGTQGMKAIKEIGGLTMVQSPEEAEHDGMPRSAIATGLVDLVVAAAEIPSRLLDLAAEPNEVAVDDDAELRRGPAADTLRDILTMVRVRTGHDFSGYKRGTLLRRLGRRMQVCQTATLSNYLDHVRDDPGELSALLRDFLISVTSFFRDPEMFAALERQVLPRLFRDRRDAVRIWVAGCATGEEAYSVAMLAAEASAEAPGPVGVQIFATDIDEDALADARLGFYPETIGADLTRERLDRFFSRERRGYRVRKELREMLLFSPHNLLRDPPFSRLGLITCRNLLIYLNRDAQERVLGTFHFGLEPDGCLMLGSSESAEGAPSLFAPLDGKQRIYTRRPGSGHVRLPPVFPAARWPVHEPLVVSRDPATLGELHHKLVEHYAAPSVLINEDLDIVHLSENAGRYLTLAGGEPSRNLLRLIRPSLRLDLRSAIFAARQPGRGEETRRVKVDGEGGERIIDLKVRAIDDPDAARGMLLVLFDENGDGEGPVNGGLPVGDGSDIEPVVRQLEEELQRTRLQLRATVEQYETSLEELKASNEELHAINEELRSATEELETSKEELQSVNEELTTVNCELKDKIDELSRSNSDLQNLIRSTDLGVLFLDRELHIKLFTPRIRDLFNVIPTDVGRPLGDITHRLDGCDLAAAARTVLANLQTVEQEVGSSRGDRFMMHASPYRSVEQRIEGVVITFVDITEIKKVEAALRAADRSKDEFLAMLSHELRNPLAPLRAALDIQRLAVNDPARIEHTRKVMERQVTHLIGLVEDLLDVSRITQGKLQLRRDHFRLGDVIQAAVDATRPFMESAGHQLEVTVAEGERWIDADFTRITQVLINLLENACKYTRTGGRIRLVGETIGAPEILRLRIIDNGMGIDAEMLPRVFDMFAQAASQKRQGGGLGIGLTLVRRLVEMHGGTVEARSDGPGRGSEFILQLPVLAPPAPPRSRRAAPASGLGAVRRILLVDDNRDITNTAGEVLRMLGHQTWEAHDGQEAVAMATEVEPDLVLLDLGLPDISGFEVARQLRALPRGKEMTIVALTGWGDHADVERARDAGMDGHVVKPIGIAELTELAGKPAVDKPAPDEPAA
jgi:two-component system, chemotaxis family, CheB/CheR fusion protein